MTTSPDELHARSLHYTITLFPGGPESLLCGLAVNLDGWHPSHGRTSDLQYKVYIAPEDVPQRLSELGAEILRRVGQAHLPSDV